MVKTPSCADCGESTMRVLGIPVYTDGKRHVRHEFVCASCEYRRYHPDAAPAVKMPQERRAKRLQKERLFDLPGAA